MYLARRWLQYDPQEWIRLPWWVREVLEEGMAEELRQKAGGDADGAGEPIPDTDADLAAAGFDVR